MISGIDSIINESNMGFGGGDYIKSDENVISILLLN